MKTTQQNLILKMLGGPVPGKLVPIEAEQCLLGVDPQCAIIRTPDGVQVKQSKGILLVNDVETDEKWLSEGDVVQLGNSVFEIEELGLPKNDSDNGAATEPTSTNDTAVLDTERFIGSEGFAETPSNHYAVDYVSSNVTETSSLDMNLLGSSNDAGNIDSKADETFGQPTADSPETVETVAPVAENDSLVAQLNSKSDGDEDSIHDRISNLENVIKQQQELTEERFNVISVHLESLCDHLLDFDDRLTAQSLASETANKSAQAANESAQAALETANLANDSIANIAFAPVQTQPVVNQACAISTPEAGDRETADTNFVDIENSKVTSQLFAQENPQPETETSATEVSAVTEEQLVTEEQPVAEEPVAEQFMPTQIEQDEILQNEQSPFQESEVIETFQEETQATQEETQVTQEETQATEFNNDESPELEEDLGLGSLLDSLREETSDSEPSSELGLDASSITNADQSLEDLEARIDAAEDSLFEKPNDESPVENKDNSVHEELASVFQSIEDETATSADDEPTTSDTSEATAETPIQTEPETVNVPQEEAQAPEAEEESESVADVLARMGVKTDIDFEADSAENSSVFSKPEEPTPAPAEEFSESEDAEAPAEGENVDDYMSALLTRLKQGPAVEPAPKTKTSGGGAKENATQAAESTVQPPPQPVKVLKPEEFVPKSVAPERKLTIAAMRELANQSVTTAVHTSDVNRKREKKLLLQLGSVMGLLAGIVLFICSLRAFDLFFLLGVLGTSAGLVCLYLLYGKKPEAGKNVAAAKPQTDQQQPAEAQPAEAQQTPA